MGRRRAHRVHRLSGPLGPPDAARYVFRMAHHADNGGLHRRRPDGAGAAQRVGGLGYQLCPARRCRRSAIMDAGPARARPHRRRSYRRQQSDRPDGREWLHADHQGSAVGRNVHGHHRYAAGRRRRHHKSEGNRPRLVAVCLRRGTHRRSGRLGHQPLLRTTPRPPAPSCCRCFCRGNCPSRK